MYAFRCLMQNQFTTCFQEVRNDQNWAFLCIMLKKTLYTAQKIKFSIKKISSVNVTKFGHIYGGNP